MSSNESFVPRQTHVCDEQKKWAPALSGEIDMVCFAYLHRAAHSLESLTLHTLHTWLVGNPIYKVGLLWTPDLFLEVLDYFWFRTGTSY